MRPFAVLAALAGVAMAAPRAVIPRQATDWTRVKAGGVDDIVLREDNLLRSEGKARTQADSDPVEGDLNINLVNNFEGGALKAYISGLDSDGRIVFLQADGGLVYPSAGGSEEPVEVSDDIAIDLPPQGETLELHLPISLESGRVYFADGDLTFYTVAVEGGDGLVQPSVSNPEDPSSELNWGFVELTLTEEGEVWANISFVDYVGIPFGMTLASRTNGTQEVLGMPPDGVERICQALAEQEEADGLPWGAHCVTVDGDKPLRVLATNVYHELNPDGFADYWTEYVDEVWEHFKENTLTINTQQHGDVDCRVEGEELQCDEDNRGYEKPDAVDILGCDRGPFGIQEDDNDIHKAVVPRLCAAFVRTTFLIDGGDYQPGPASEEYYKIDPTHHYSRIVHEVEVDGKGYAFSYDDVHPDGEEAPAGLITDSNPDTLTFFIGGHRE